MRESSRIDRTHIHAKRIKDLKRLFPDRPASQWELLLASIAGRKDYEATQNTEPSRTRWITSPSIHDIITLRTISMAIALTKRLSNFWDLCAFYDTIRDRKTITTPSGSKTPDRIEWRRSRYARVAHCP